MPPPQYVSDNDHYNTVDARGEVTGAGIATLQTIPDAPSRAVSICWPPRGTVDAGDAGIRVSGNLVIGRVDRAQRQQHPGAGHDGPACRLAPTANVNGALSANNTTAATPTGRRADAEQ